MYKVAIIGCGGMARAWIDATKARKKDDIEIVALVDINIDNANKLKEKYGLDAKTYTDMEKAILENECNLIYNVTVPKVHMEIDIKAMELGCDVITEKPLCENIEEAYKIKEAATKTGKRVAVMQNRRYLSDIVKMKEILNSNELGELGYISSTFFLGPHFGGFRDEMDSPLLLDMAVHTFDQARYLMNDKPVSVYCEEYNPSWSWYDGDASMIAIFEMASGIRYMYTGSWCATGKNTTWECDWRFECSKGNLLWDGAKEYNSEQVDQAKWETKEVPYGKGHTGCINDILDCFDKNIKPMTDIDDNIETMKMVFGAMESSRLGKKINLLEV